MNQVLHQVAEHLLESGEEVFNAVKGHEIGMTLLLVEISAQEEPHRVLHDSLLYCWKVIWVQAKVLDQPRCLLTHIIVAHLVDKFDLELLRVLYQ